MPVIVGRVAFVIPEANVGITSSKNETTSNTSIIPVTVLEDLILDTKQLMSE